MVLLDATMLLLLLYPKVPAPIDPSTGKVIVDPQKRMDYLIQCLQKTGTKIIVPTPVLSEILVRAGAAGAAYTSKLQSSSKFKIAPFDTHAAIEVALMAREDLGKRKKDINKDFPYAKLKYDRQIVAIGKTLGVTIIYSDDKQIKSLAEGRSIRVIQIGELPLPPEEAQQNIFPTNEA